MFHGVWGLWVCASVGLQPFGKFVCGVLKDRGDVLRNLASSVRLVYGFHLTNRGTASDLAKHCLT